MTLLKVSLWSRFDWNSLSALYGVSVRSCFQYYAAVARSHNLLTHAIIHHPPKTDPRCSAVSLRQLSYLLQIHLTAWPHYASLRKISSVIRICLLTKSENEAMIYSRTKLLRLLSGTWCVGLTIKLNNRPTPSCGNAANGIWLTCKIEQSVHTYD